MNYLTPESSIGSGAIDGVGGTCHYESNSGISPGTQVTVSDGSGSVIGVGKLGTGTVVNVQGQTTIGSTETALVQCSLPAVISGLPRTGFYSLAISGTGSPAVESFASLQADHWNISLSVS